MAKLQMNLHLRRHRISLSVISVLVITFIFYYFVYVPSREIKVNARGFHTLENLDENISKKRSNLLQVSNTFIETEDLLNFRTKDGGITKKKVVYRVPDGQLVFDGIHRSRIKAPHHDAGFAIKSPGDSTRLSILHYLIPAEKRGSYKLTDSLDQCEISISLHSFMRSIVTFEFFENYLVLHDKQVIYQHKNSGVSSVRMDSLVSAHLPVGGSSIREIKLAGMRYKFFIYPIRLDQEHYSYLCGVISLASYNNEKFHLPDNLIVITAFLILFLLASFPLLKLALISKDEPLNSFDVIGALFTLVFLVSLSVMMLLYSYSYQKQNNVYRDQVLKVLSDTIVSSFQGEMNLALQQLEAFESVIARDTLLKDKLLIDTLAGRVQGQKIQLEVINDTFIRKNTNQVFPKIYPNFKFALWIDPKGDEQFYFTPDPDTPTLINYKTRKYFQKVIQKQLWNFPGDSTRKFFMDGIYSFTTGEFRAALSIKSSLSDSLVAAITAPLKSVINPSTPIGFQFCIMDEHSNVLFHSDTRKNLNENFLEECIQNSELTASLYASQDHLFNADYQGKNYRMYIQPVKSLPLYIVTFNDTSIFASANLQMVELASFFILANIVIIILISGLCLLSRKKKTKLKRPAIDLEWIWPAREKSLVYGYNILLNIFLFTMLFMVYTISDSEWIKLLCTLSVSAFTILFFFLTNHFEKSFIEFRKENALLVYTAIGLWFILLAAFLLITNDWYLFILISSLFLAACVFCWRRMRKSGDPDSSTDHSHKVIQKFERIINARSYSTLFVVMLFSWVIVIAYLPSIEFFSLAHDREQEIISKAQSLATATSKNTLATHQPKTKNFPGVDYTNTFFQTSILENKPTVKKWKKSSTQWHDPRSLSNRLRIPHNEWTRQTNLLLDTPDSIGTFNWLYFKDSILLEYTRPEAISKPIYVSTKHEKFGIPFLINFSGKGSIISMASVPLLFFLLILLPLIIYQVLKSFSSQIFGFNWVPMKSQISIAREILNSQPNHSKHGVWNQHPFLYLTALPEASGVQHFLEHVMKEDASQHIIDCASLSMPDQPSKTISLSSGSYIVLHHFEFGVKEKKTNDLKLEWVRKANTVKAHCLIISSMTATDLLAELKTAEQNFQQKQLQLKGPDMLIPDSTWEWDFVLREFKQVYCPLQELNVKDALSHVPPKPNQSLSEFLKEECNQGNYLSKLKSTLQKKADDLEDRAEQMAVPRRKIEEELIMKIQSLATPYYRSIWDSLGATEQNMLYDVAKEGVLNTRNSMTINKLLAIGLLHYDDSLKIMNQSFRNFILTGIPPEEHLQLDRAFESTGTWNRLRTPLLILIIGILVFIFITQQEVFNKFILWIGAFAGGLATLSNLFHLLPLGSSQPKK